MAAGKVGFPDGREENIEKGKEAIEREVKKIGIKYSDLVKPEWLQLAMDRYKFATVDDLYASIGFGGISVNKLMARLLDEYRKEHEEEDFEEKIQELAKAKPTKSKPSKTGVVVKGIDNCLVKLITHVFERLYIPSNTLSRMASYGDARVEPSGLANTRPKQKRSASHANHHLPELSANLNAYCDLAGHCYALLRDSSSGPRRQLVSRGLEECFWVCFCFSKERLVLRGAVDLQVELEVFRGEWPSCLQHPLLSVDQ